MNTMQSFDKSLLESMNSFVQINPLLTKATIMLAEYLVYFIPFLFIIWWFFPSFVEKYKDNKIIKQDLLFLIIIGIFNWQIISRLVALVWERPRPFAGLIGAKELIFHRPTYSFPSDHALLLFTLCFGFWFLGYRKIGWYLLGVAFIVSISRIAVAVHWPTDIIAGILIAYITTSIAYLNKKYIEKIIIRPLYWLARQIKLT